MGLGPPLFNFEFCLLGLSDTIGVGSIVEGNRLMKNCAIFAVFCQLLFVSWKDFVIVWQNTVHLAQSVTLLWLAYRIGVVEQCCQVVKCNKIFYKNGVILHAYYVHGRRREFFMRATVGFFKTFF